MASLERLLEAVRWQPKKDRLWLAGDLVNRGPRSLDVLRWARAHDDSIAAVLGNHDLHLLGLARGVIESKKRDTLDAIFAAPDGDDLVEWLARRPLAHEEAGFLMVHAGVAPGWTLDEVRRRARAAEALLVGPERGVLLAGREDLGGAFAEQRESIAAFTRLRVARPDGRMVLDYDGPPKMAPPGTRPWWELAHPSLPPIVCGHWAAAGLHLGDKVVALDSGCVWGGKLTALRLTDRKLVQVDCQERSARA